MNAKFNVVMKENKQTMAASRNNIYLLLFFINFVVAEEIPDVCPNIVSKSMWGGRPSKEVEYLIVPVKYVIVQHTVTPTCDTLSECSQRVTSIQDYHMNINGFHDIGLNFLIGNDGNIYEGAGWHKVGAHTYGYNNRGIGVAFIGTFGEELPSEKAITAAQNLLECGIQIGELDRRYKLLGQRQVFATESPGLKLYQEIQKWPHWTTKI